jgi:hypothetical protein
MTRAPWRTAVACLALLAPVLAGAHEAHDHRGGAASAKGGEARGSGLGASAAFDAGGVLWAVAREGKHVVVRRSADLGRAWSQAAPVNAAPEDVGADGDARPKIAVGPGGEIYVTWTKPLSKPYTGDIRFARSLDGGRSFSAPLTIHTDRQEITHRFDSVAVNRSGQVFVVWIDKRDGVAAAKAKAGAYRGAAVYFAVSDDRGASFRGDFKLADHSCECCRIALVPRDDGSVLAMWRHVFSPNIRDHALARMQPDGRAGEVVRATFDDWRIDVCPHHGPSLAADAAGRLHAVWFSQGPGHAGVFYGRLGEGRVEGERRVGGETAEHADLAANGRRIAVAWKEFDGQRSQLRAMLSEDGGTTWRDRGVAATAGASDQPRVLERQGRFYVFWNTRQEPFSVYPLQ